jgi:hypothetical protein
MCWADGPCWLPVGINVRNVAVGKASIEIAAGDGQYQWSSRAMVHITSSSFLLWFIDKETTRGGGAC